MFILVVGLNKLLDKQSHCQWLEMPWCSCEDTVISVLFVSKGQCWCKKMPFLFLGDKKTGLSINHRSITYLSALGMLPGLILSWSFYWPIRNCLFDLQCGYTVRFSLGYKLLYQWVRELFILCNFKLCFINHTLTACEFQLHTLSGISFLQ